MQCVNLACYLELSGNNDHLLQFFLCDSKGVYPWMCVGVKLRIQFTLAFSKACKKYMHISEEI